MNIYTSLSPQDLGPTLPGRAGSVDCAAVLDVLRATSVMTTALAGGAKRVFTVAQIEEARALAGNLDPRGLLCGERGCRPIEGFDLGNSPAQYDSTTVRGQSLVLTTTNGTRAIAAAAAARTMLAVSFMNLGRSVRELSRHRVVHLVCAGTDGHLSGEDVLLAGAIVDRLTDLSAESSLTLCDSSRTALDVWRFRVGDVHPQQRLCDLFRETRGGRNLTRLGFSEDLACCAQIDRFDVLVHRVSRAPAEFHAG